MLHSKLFLCSIAVIAQLSNAQSSSENPAPSAPNTEFLRVKGQGQYNYVCQNGQFQFSRATGDLYDMTEYQKKVGTFTYQPASGPYYVDATFQVGGNSSAVTFRQSVSVPSSNPNSLPNALFNATDSGTGSLEGATFVSQIDTQSGLPPTVQCDNGSPSAVAFTATYVFYKVGGSFTSGSYAAGDPLKTLPNVNAFTGALLDAQPIKVVDNEGQDMPWQVVNYDGSLFGVFFTKQEAIDSACGIQRDECARRASSNGSGYSSTQGVRVQDCFNQLNQCKSASP